MTKQVKGYKFEIVPTDDQRVLLSRTFGCCRFVYNNLLAQSKEQYEKWKEDQTSPKPDVSQIGLTLAITTLKKEYDWLYEVSSVAIQQKARDLGSAFSNFFRELKKGKKVGYPKFKKKGYNDSFRLENNAFSIEKDEETGKRIFKIAKSKIPIKVYWSRELPSTPSSVTISRRPDGRYFASFVCEYTPKKTSGRLSTGIDLGIKDFATLSSGETIPNPRHYVSSQRRLKRIQQSLSRKKKDSKNRHKARLKVAKLHQQIVNQRHDFHHQLSRKLVNDNQVLVFESLTVKNMIRNRRLAKHIADVSWSRFKDIITYKTIESGHCITVFVNRFYPSTQTCSQCNHRLEGDNKLPLRVRRWQCPVCDSIHDRDINAAKNLLKLGKQYLIDNDIPLGECFIIDQ